MVQLIPGGDAAAEAAGRFRNVETGVVFSSPLLWCHALLSDRHVPCRDGALGSIDSCRYFAAACSQVTAGFMSAKAPCGFAFQAQICNS